MFVDGKPFQPSLMFVGKAKGGAPERFYISFISLAPGANPIETF